MASVEVNARLKWHLKLISSSYILGIGRTLAINYLISMGEVIDQKFLAQILLWAIERHDLQLFKLLIQDRKFNLPEYVQLDDGRATTCLIAGVANELSLSE